MGLNRACYIIITLNIGRLSKRINVLYDIAPKPPLSARTFVGIVIGNIFSKPLTCCHGILACHALTHLADIYRRGMGLRPQAT
jgi:hypothetical protein